MTLRAIAPTSTITTAVVAGPRPVIRRPSSRSYSGEVHPSTRPKIQTIAATLMNSGTTTKNPAMKLRRSQCIALHPSSGECREQDDAERDPIPGEPREAGAAHEPQERSDHERRGDERHHEADRDLDRALGTEVTARIEQIVQEGGRHRRHREKERELGRRQTIDAH